MGLLTICIACDPEYPSLALTNNTRNSIPLGLRWLRECLSDHPRCQSRPPDNCKAKRLIDVGEQSISGISEQPRLVETTSLTGPISYVTLSHCWGTGQVFKLLQQNVDLLMRKIPPEGLSGVFRDAIDVTRKAGIKYIWTDSLCIVQNSSTDWEVESQKMGDIYQHAMFNIAATGFTDGSRGLFVERDPGLVDPVRLQLKRAFEVVGMSNPEPGVYRLVEMSTWIEGVEHAPLNYRGWVIQERFLSPRILHFGRDSCTGNVPLRNYAKVL
jgi:hypothetical protein